VFEGEQQQIWLLARNNPTSCTQVSKRSVAYFAALMIPGLIVLSPYWRPFDSCIAAIGNMPKKMSAIQKQLFHSMNKFN
jgi:hypothetical protein